MSHNSKYYKKKLIAPPKNKSLSHYGFTKSTPQSSSTKAMPMETSTSSGAEEFLCTESSVSSDHDHHDDAMAMDTSGMEPVSHTMTTTSLCSSSTQPQLSVQPSSSLSVQSSVQLSVQPISSPSVQSSVQLSVQPSSLLSVQSSVQSSSVQSSSAAKQPTLSVRNLPFHEKHSKFQKQFNWLYLSQKGYVCKVCEFFGEVAPTQTMSVFMVGTELGDHPVRKLEKHQNSEVHKQALKKYIRSKGATSSIRSVLGNRDNEDQQESDNRQMNRQYMKALIDTIFLVIRKRWALDSVSDLMEHCEFLGSPALSKFKRQNKSLAYISSTSVTSMVQAIGLHFENEFLASVSAADFIAVLADESTDSANRTQFAVMIRMLSGDNVNDHFLGLVNVERTDAASLTEAIESLLAKHNIDIQKVMFVGFDGCNTMSGELSGVQRRFRHLVPHSLYINCRSHRLALCVKHLMNHFPILVDVDEVLLSVYKLFEYSPQKFAVFKDVQAAYEKKELVLVRAAATRWLSHGKACERFIGRYIQIIDSLDEIWERNRQPEVSGLRDMVTNKNTLAAIAALCDILEPVNYFCKYLQGAVDFSQVSLRLKDLLDTLEGLVVRFRATLDHDDPNLTLSQLPVLFDEIDERTVFARRLRDGNVYTQEQVIEELAVPMVYKLIGELQDGFHSSPVLNAFSVFHMKNLPDNMTELTNYGKESIQTLNDHYGQMKIDKFRQHETQAPRLLCPDMVSAEFEGFKHMMFLTRRRNPDTDMLKVMLEDDQLRTSYSNIFKLVLLKSLIPSSTASVERLFSLMNSLVTDSRNRLGQQTLNALMRICSLGKKTLDDHEKEAILDVFKNMKLREIRL